MCRFDFCLKGCDASVLLDEGNGNNNQSTEKDAIPNSTLKGFDFIDAIKEELEASCSGIVSCSDTLVLATRDAIVLVCTDHLDHFLCCEGFCVCYHRSVFPVFCFISFRIYFRFMEN